MKEFWNKVNKILLGSITVVVIFVLGFIWWLFEPQQNVPMWCLSMVIIICYVVCVVIYAYTTKDVKITYVLPEVKTLRRTDEKIIFLLEKNELFTQGADATICFQDEDDEIEITLGLGYVETINTQGNMQVVFIKEEQNPTAKEIISTLIDNKHCRKSIKIKPSVLRKSVEEDLMTWGEI